MDLMINIGALDHVGYSEPAIDGAYQTRGGLIRMSSGPMAVGRALEGITNEAVHIVLYPSYACDCDGGGNA